MSRAEFGERRGEERHPGRGGPASRRRHEVPKTWAGKPMPLLDAIDLATLRHMQFHVQQHLREPGDIVVGEGVGIVAVGVEHAPAEIVVAVHAGDDDFGAIARIAGDVAGAEIVDVGDDERVAGLEGLAAGAEEGDG